MWETVETASEGAPFKYFNIHQKLINVINGSKLSSGQGWPTFVIKHCLGTIDTLFCDSAF